MTREVNIGTYLIGDQKLDKKRGYDAADVGGTVGDSHDGTRMVGRQIHVVDVEAAEDGRVDAHGYYQQGYGLVLIIGAGVSQEYQGDGRH